MSNHERVLSKCVDNVDSKPVSKTAPAGVRFYCIILIVSFNSMVTLLKRLYIKISSKRSSHVYPSDSFKFLSNFDGP